MKMMHIAVLSALLVPSIGSAQNTLSANFLGLSSLELSPATAGASDDGLIKTGHVGHAAGDVRPALKSGAAPAATSAAASLPAPQPQQVAAGVAEVHGFSGLSHFDQRFAGTGQYVNTNFSLEPPDQGLCVGNGSVMEPINDAIAVFDPSGARIGGPVPINQFFNLAPSVIRSTPLVFGQFVSDPRCYYDAATGHWFISVTEIDTNPATGKFATHSSVLLAASVTSDPSGAYYLYSIDTTDGHGQREGHPNCPCFGDQPLIGADTNGFYVSTNEFPITGPGFNGAQIYAMSKAALLSGGHLHVVHFNVGADVPVPPVDQPNGGIWYSIQPASGASTPGVEYFLSALQFGPAPFDNRLAVWALTNTNSLNEEERELHLLHTVISSQSYGVVNAFAAQQKPGPTPLRDFFNATVPKENDNLNQLNANDDRMNQVVFAAGDLWAGVNTNLSVGGQTRQGIAWFSVRPSLSGGQLSAQIDRQGYVAVAGEDVLFPSIGVNQNGAAVMSFTLAGPDYWPSAGYVRLNDHAGDVHIAGAGVGPDDGFTGYKAEGGNGIARWGDYTAAVADEQGHIWIAAEYIGQTCTDDQFAQDTTCGGTRTLFANWGTFIARVQTGD